LIFKFKFFLYKKKFTFDINLKNLKMVIVQRFYKDNEFLFKKMIEIRKKVFIEEQGVDKKLEFDDDENIIFSYYLVWKDLVPIATGRWKLTKKGVKLERFAVLPEHRNLKIGAFLLKKILEDISFKKEKVYLHSQESALNFYKRNGFKKIGKSFLEANILHYEMIFVKN